MKYNLPYSKKIMKYFTHPKNIGVIRKADGVGRVGNIICGDVMELYIKIKKDKKGVEKISDAKFQTFGCVTAIALSSMLTDMVKGKTLKQAMKITNKSLLKESGKVPPIKVHCSVLAADALQEAIYDYLSKNKRKVSKELEKQHKRIMKDLKTLEHIHPELVTFEKRALKRK